MILSKEQAIELQKQYENSVNIQKEEVWHVIPGDEFECRYFASSLGRIFECEGDVAYFRNRYGGYKYIKHHEERILEQHIYDKYPSVNIAKCGSVFVHKLVALAFLEKLPGDEQVNHIDRIVDHNTPDNLEWCTISENIIHSLSQQNHEPEFDKVWMRNSCGDVLCVSPSVSKKLRGCGWEYGDNSAESTKGRNAGYIWIHHDGNHLQKTIDPNDLDKYRKQGWNVGVLRDHTTRKGQIWITDGEKELSIIPEELVEYESIGFHVGRCSTTKGYKMINKNGIQAMVSNEDIDTYIKDGWELGQVQESSTKDTIILTDVTNNKIIHVKSKEEADKLLSSYPNRYELGRLSSKGNVHIHNPQTGEKKMVSKDQLNQYLMNGWVKGRPKSITCANKVWIYNTSLQKNLRVTAEEVDEYLSKGWLKGRKMHW